MAIDLTIDLNDESCTSYCDKNNYFLGSSRTYAYFVKWFQDPWQFGINDLKFYCNSDQTSAYKPGDYLQGWYSNTFFHEKGIILQDNIIKTDPRCISTLAMSNAFWFENQYQGDSGKTDTLRLTKTFGIVSESINEYTGEVVKWRDDGIIFGGGFSPLFLSFWIGCGEPCYPCSYEDVQCGYPWLMMNGLTDNMDNYWDVANEDHFPYFNKAFVLDWYGRIARGPEPGIGWYEFTVLNSINCQYCHCVFFCILRQCIDAWFAVRDYEAKIFFLDEAGGIPYSDSKFLESWGKEMQDKFNFGNKDIKLDHLADESVFIGGYADHRLGTINFGSGSRYGGPSVELYGQKISGITEFEYNNSIYGKQPEASFTNGDGKSKYFIDSFRGAVNSGGQIEITDVSVKNKNQTLISGISNFGWIYCDIPSGINPEYSMIKFSADGGASFGDVVEQQCPSLGCDLPRTIFDLKLQRLFCRTSKDNGNFKKYDEAVNKANSNTLWWSAPTITYSGPLYKQEYYKRYIKKIVKAPYNLYVKSGEESFRSCKLGETLKDLSPGRYYFPNPIPCDTFFQHAGQSAIVDENSIEIEPSEEADFRKNFSLKLNQFVGKNELAQESAVSGSAVSGSAVSGSARSAKSAFVLQEKYKEAVKILGKPESSAIRMEINSTPAIEYAAKENTSTTNVLNSIKELANSGKLDQSIVDSLKQLGIL